MPAPASARIIAFLRSQRSTRAPANGVIRICGTCEASNMVASCVTDPVCWKTKMLRANAVRLVPTSETNCPAHTMENVFMLGPEGSPEAITGCSAVDICRIVGTSQPSVNR